jgi:hypothetical protein
VPSGSLQPPSYLFSVKTSGERLYQIYNVSDITSSYFFGYFFGFQNIRWTGFNHSMIWPSEPAPPHNLPLNVAIRVGSLSQVYQSPWRGSVTARCHSLSQLLQKKIGPRFITTVGIGGGDRITDPYLPDLFQLQYERDAGEVTRVIQSNTTWATTSPPPYYLPLLRRGKAF